MGLRDLSCSAPSLRLGIRPVYPVVYASNIHTVTRCKPSEKPDHSERADLSKELQEALLSQILGFCRVLDHT